jgi:hypothetical protein
MIGYVDMINENKTACIVFVWTEYSGEERQATR